MCNEYFEIMLVRVRKKIKTPTQNPSTATTTRRVEGGGVGWWYNCEFSVIPLPTRARTVKGWPTQATTRVRAWLGIDNSSSASLSKRRY